MYRHINNKFIFCKDIYIIFKYSAFFFVKKNKLAIFFAVLYLM